MSIQVSIHGTTGVATGIRRNIVLPLNSSSSRKTTIRSGIGRSVIDRAAVFPFRLSRSRPRPSCCLQTFRCCLWVKSTARLRRSCTSSTMAIQPLVEAVRQGRRTEFASFAWSEDIPDPQDPATFERSRIQLGSPRDPRQAAMLRWTRRLIDPQVSHSLVGRRRREVGTPSMSSNRASGARVVLPEPGGACSTTAGFFRTASFSFGRKGSIGYSFKARPDFLGCCGGCVRRNPGMPSGVPPSQEIKDSGFSVSC